jgi:hypothetical protein
VLLAGDTGGGSNGGCGGFDLQGGLTVRARAFEVA